MPYKDFKKIQALLDEALIADRFAVRRQLGRLKQRVSGGHPPENIKQQLDRLAKQLTDSAVRRQKRAAVRPRLTFAPSLPISARKDDIITAIRKHQVVIISGETGSGKTTQIPKFCLAAGRGIDGRIGCTQPRRIAATSVARRIAEEMGESLGRSVGYKIRFQDRTVPDALIKIMTDGIMLTEVQRDRSLSEYDTIIVDEAHERSLNIDFILGLLKMILRRRRDLKLIITSATIDTAKFSKAFDDAPVIEVSGRMYPVKVIYYGDDPAWCGLTDGSDDEATHVDMAVAAVRKLKTTGPSGDILVFMPTEQDIRDTCDILDGDEDPGSQVMPLFARLSATEQARVFARTVGRKIIVATNVAETSLTIPGIRYVVDTGLARISQYNPRSRTKALPVVPVSRSSADQRKGRCGRVENGVCIRLYTEEDYQSRPLYTPPEILRSNLAEVILRMAALRLGDLSVFPFIDKPSPKNITDGTEVLYELGAIEKRRPTRGDKQSKSLKNPSAESNASVTARAAGTKAVSSRHQGPAFVLTRRGSMMARMPVDPLLARMLIEARKLDCLDELTVIAAALSIQDPRERPADCADDVDRAQASFVEPRSDFLTLLNIWNRYQETWQLVKTTNQMKKFCRAHFLSFRRMREWRDICVQLGDILVECGLKNNGRLPENDDDRYAAIHRSILSGFLAQIAVRKEKNIFRATKGREVMVFPGSAIFNRAGEWIVAAEMVETSRLFARVAANIDPGWLEELGGALCRSTYLNPRWDSRRGQVVATQQVSLFGLVIVPGRTVSFGRIDPDTATDVFVRSALVNGEVERPLEFLQYNRQRVRKIRDMENRIRRRDILVDDEEQVRFYKQRLAGVYDLRQLDRMIRKRGGDGFLRMKADDLMNYQPNGDLLTGYPNSVQLGGGQFTCNYNFDPGQPKDGLTVSIPLVVAPTVPVGATDWLVPGLLGDKIEALLKGLPKRYRKQLVPVGQTAGIVLKEMPRDSGALVSSLGKFIYHRFGVDIPAAAWPADGLADHLNMRIAITDPRGEIIKSSRDPQILRQLPQNDLTPDGWEAARRRWEKTGVSQWDFGDLPVSIDLEVQDGDHWAVFPGLAVVDDGSGKRIDLKLFRNADTAAASHAEGVAALYRILFSKDLKFMKKSLALRPDRSPAARYFGGIRVLEKRIYDAVVVRLFRRDIRIEADFHAEATALAARIIPCGRELSEKVLPVIDAFHAARTVIHHLDRGHRTHRLLVDFCRQRQDELARLVPENFMEIYDLERLGHLPRYIKAVEIRARRASVNFEKEQLKAAELKRFSSGLSRLLKTLSPSASPEKRDALEAFYWLFEEYKVSLFAQELKTAVPVSEMRLQEAMDEIERLL